ncbi:MAG TPA: DUF2087 domain-containing protein, partial [Jatrophihabitantaceae bacterium]|nr:DUF2087 domain-containing protein [Jatrophihabitantaceae bacterium]
MDARAEHDRIVRRYLSDGRLRSMPRRGRRRRMVLEFIVQAFEPGQRYDEAAVNAILRAFWPDVAALRRYLVDEQLLDRAAGM